MPSGIPSWFNERIGKTILVNGKPTILRDGYCVGCRHHTPNYDELVIITDAGKFNTDDEDVSVRWYLGNT